MTWMDDANNIRLLLANATVARRTTDLSVPNLSAPFTDPPARLLMVRPAGGREQVEARLSVVFAGETYDVDVLDEDRFVLTFPTRTFSLIGANGAAAAANALGLALAGALDALVVEPDLPRGAMPIKPDPVRGLESVDNFPPGCWVPEEADLNETPRWALDAIKVRDAWRFSQLAGRPTMGAGIVIAQPDTGITAHPQLAGVKRVGSYNTLGDGPSNDATDRLEDGFSLNPGHGTGTASVVVSLDQGTSDQVVGSAPMSGHIPIRALRSVWLHEELPVAAAIDLAVEKGAHVITMSLGGVALPFSPLRAAIRRAVAKNVIVMAAAGNCVGTVVYPARFSECLAVAGTDSRGNKWPGSCSGPTVDISAPAQNVLRAFFKPQPDGSVGQGQGTSFAVALTAGVAACWLAHHGRDALIQEAAKRGEALQTMFRRLLRATARRPGNWDSGEMGAGIVDADALLRAPFELGLGTESPAFEAEARAPADEMRAFLTEILEQDPGLDDDALIRHGAQLASALLSRRLDPATRPGVSQDLLDRLPGPVAAKLGSALAQPSIKIVDTDVLAAQAGRAERLRRNLAFGKAVAEGAPIESAGGGGAKELPTPKAISALLDRLLQTQMPTDPREQADFERAIELVRRHGMSGLDKLPDLQAVLKTTELGALEALIKADGSRPSLLVKNGKIDENHPLIGGWGAQLMALRAQIEDISSLCGRIQPTGGHASRYCGTGLLIDPSGPWILSNFHVLQQALRSFPVLAVKSQRGLTFAGGLEIDFLGESDSAATRRWSIVEAVFPDNAGEGFGRVDAVLLKLGTSLDGFALPGEGNGEQDRIRFDPAAGLTNGEFPLIAAVGFPSRPSLTTGTTDGIDWGWVVGQLFGGRFGVKRLAPGEFYRSVGSFSEDAVTKYAFGHDLTTLHGSSGSVVFSLTQAGNPACGLHFAGFDNDSNFALTTEALNRGFDKSGLAFP